MARLLALREGDADDRPVPSARLQSSAVRTALEEAIYLRTKRRVNRLGEELLLELTNASWPRSRYRTRCPSAHCSDTRCR